MNSSLPSCIGARRSFWKRRNIPVHLWEVAVSEKNISWMSHEELIGYVCQIVLSQYLHFTVRILNDLSGFRKIPEARGISVFSFLNICPVLF
jgi:hypothetical protein